MHRHQKTIAALSITALVASQLSCAPGPLLGQTPRTPDDFLQLQAFSWQTEETPRFFVHCESNSFADERLPQLVSLHEKAMPRILELLGEETYPSKIHIFAVGSRASMKSLVGYETNGCAFPEQNMICCVFSESVAGVGAHELMHIISSHCWAPRRPGRVWLSEGLAVYADDVWRGLDLHRLCKHLADVKALVPLEDLLGDFGAFDSMISYPESGSFVKFLYESYGRERLKQLWQLALPDIKRVYGKNPSELENEWHHLISKTDASGIKYDQSRSRGQR